MSVNGTVMAICISPNRGGPMKLVDLVEAIVGAGLSGDRYCIGEGSFNKGNVGKRQVTLMNAIFFKGTEFNYTDSRRNLFVEGTELMYLIGKEFTIGEVRMRGLKYCDPCDRPSKLSGKPGFKENFHDRGGLVAEILTGGIIKMGDLLIPPDKGY